MQELRTENLALRSQLLELNAAGPAQAWWDGPSRSGGGGSGECREREAAAHAAALRAAEADAASREALQLARREQLAASLALMGQLRRVQALEALRLSDLEVGWDGAGWSGVDGMWDAA